MTFIDANVLSTFAVIDRLDLLFTLFATTLLHVSENVAAEVMHGLQAGYMHLGRVIELMEDPGPEMGIAVHPAGTAEQALFPLIPLAPNHPDRLAKGELDTIALAWTQVATIVTNERRVANFCRSNSYRSIRCFTTADVFRAAWQLGVLTPVEVRELIEDLADQGEHIPHEQVFPLP